MRTSTRLLALGVVLLPALYAACSDELGNQSLSPPGYASADSGSNTTTGDDDSSIENIYEAGPDPEFDSNVPPIEASVLDSGVKDSGPDSGPKDSGADSGPKDSGPDSGPDSGSVVDSGIKDAGADGQ